MWEYSRHAGTVWLLPVQYCSRHSLAFGEGLAMKLQDSSLTLHIILYVKRKVMLSLCRLARTQLYRFLLLVVQLSIL